MRETSEKCGELLSLHLHIHRPKRVFAYRSSLERLESKQQKSVSMAFHCSSTEEKKKMIRGTLKESRLSNGVCHSRPSDLLLMNVKLLGLCGCDGRINQVDGRWPDMLSLRRCDVRICMSATNGILIFFYSLLLLCDANERRRGRVTPLVNSTK